MPTFQPSNRGGTVGLEGGGDVHVLDLETAVKDGVLGGGDGGGGGFDGGFREKLEIDKIIEELNFSDVPPVFVCPISLEPMQNPVTLCTGQTYERSNIMKWLNLGHFTCPTTMQELWDGSVTPNKTLYHLIHTWFSQKYVQMKKKSEDVQGRASELLGTIKKGKGQVRVQALMELKQVVAAHATARKTVVDESGVPLLSSLLAQLTSYAVGSEVIAILVDLTLNSEAKKNLMQPEKISLMVDMLNEGSIETKINCTRLMETLMEEKDFGSSHRLLVGLMRLLKDKRHPDGILPGLSLLRSMSFNEQARNLIVTIGAVPQLVDMLPSLNPNCLELAMFILDTLSSLPEGRLALKNCSNTISNMVKLIMRVSEICTQHALSILWSVCTIDPEECSSIAVDAGLAAKLLLVIQSGCSPVLKQQSAELLKLCSLNYTDTTFISKCKLTRTIQ